MRIHQLYALLVLLGFAPAIAASDKRYTIQLEQANFTGPEIPSVHFDFDNDGTPDEVTPQPLPLYPFSFTVRLSSNPASPISIGSGSNGFGGVSAFSLNADGSYPSLAFAVYAWNASVPNGFAVANQKIAFNNQNGSFTIVDVPISLAGRDVTCTRDFPGRSNPVCFFASYPDYGANQNPSKLVEILPSRQLVDITSEAGLPYPMSINPNWQWFEYPPGSQLDSAAFYDFNGDGLPDLLLGSPHNLLVRAFSQPNGQMSWAAMPFTEGQYQRVFAPLKMDSWLESDGSTDLSPSLMPPCAYLALRTDDVNPDRFRCYDRIDGAWYELTLPFENDADKRFSANRAVRFWDRDGRIVFAARNKSGSNVKLFSMPPRFSVSDIFVTEGSSGTVEATFAVQLFPPSSQTATVDYSTANGTASSGLDYVATAGVLTFLPGESSKALTVAINGDTVFEVNETFLLNLSNSTGPALIADGQATATIVDDDAPPGPLSCPSGTLAPGASFTTTVSGGSSSTDWVAMYPTGQSSNTPWIGPYHYVPLPRPANVGFNAPATSGSYELRLFANDTFTLLGSCPFSVQAGPTLTINDATVTEGNTGTVNATFTVTLNPASSGSVTIGFTTADGSAVSSSDYAAASGTLAFAAGETTKTITVTINGDTSAESNETFFVNLSGATGDATIGDGQGLGTITNDDAPPGPLSCPSGTLAPGASFTTTVSGGSSSTDWVAMYPTGQSSNTPWIGPYHYVPLPRPANVGFNAPATSGSYELRLFANDTFTLLGSCPFSVTSP
jgi:hypothetical protein